MTPVYNDTTISALLAFIEILYSIKLEAINHLPSDGLIIVVVHHHKKNPSIHYYF